MTVRNFREGGGGGAAAHQARKIAALPFLRCCMHDYSIQIQVPGFRMCQASQAHPHIVLFLGVFETPQHVQIVTEYLAGGTLYDRIVECNRLAEYEASTVFYRLLMSTLGDFSPVYVTI